MIIIDKIFIRVLTLIHQTNLVLEAREATIDVEVMNLTELGEPLRKIEAKTVYDIIHDFAGKSQENLSLVHTE